MARTPLFKNLQRTLRKACLVEKYPQYRRQIEEGELDRRQFMKIMAAAGAATLPGIPMTSLLLRDSFASTLTPAPLATNLPVVVLGGGLSGLTAAYRLNQAGANCAIYEASGRIGGRIFTKDRFNAEGMFCELGGELIDTVHTDMLDLAREVGCQIDDFVPTEAGLVPGHFFIGGKHYHERDVLPRFAPFTKRVIRDMKKVFKDWEDPTINYKTHNREGIRFDRMSLQEYLYSMTDVDKWILDTINVSYLTEYGADTDQQSALNLFVLINPDASAGFQLFGESDESKRVRGGNSRLIEGIERAIAPRVPMHLGHELIAIEKGASSMKLTFQSPGGTQTVAASKVICTVPFILLRNVDGLKKLGLSPAKSLAINELAYGSNTKIMLGFKERFWRKEWRGIAQTNGYTFTDTPGQTYWDSSRLQSGNSGIITNFTGGTMAQRARLDWAQETLADFEQIYPGATPLYDGSKAMFQWGNYRFARASYACPKPGQYTTIVGSPGEPECGGRLLFAGEHVSEEWQGYMNGAVESGNRAARMALKGLVSRPATASAVRTPAAEPVS